MSNTAFAWLIERPVVDPSTSDQIVVGCEYLHLVRGERMCVWTRDPSEALRFARKKDANTVINAFYLQGAAAIEHGWYENEAESHE